MIDTKIWVGLSIAAIAYVVYRIMTAPQRELSTEFEKEVNEILTKDEYRVKGRYE